jgi:aminoglycoside phosphotransferase (APT) family kinase protein
MTARKDGLERSHPVIPLPEGEAARLLRPLIGNAGIEAVQLLNGGLGNSNYLVHLDGASAPMVIRLHARGAESRDLELNLLRLLHRRVPVPRVLDAGNDAVDGTRAYIVLEYCRGQPLNDWLPRVHSAEVEEIGRAVGTALAMIAEVTLEQPGLLGPDLKVKSPMFTGEHPYFDFFVDSLFHGNAGRALGEVLRDRVWRFLCEQRSLIEGFTTQRTLVHADFDGTNILVDRRGGGFVISGVIDWEYALSGPRVIDLSSILRYPENLPPGFEPALLAGFRAAGGTLPEPWVILVRLVDMLAFCAFLNKDSAATRRRIYETALRAAHEKLLAMGY